MKTIIVPTDFSNTAGNAIKYAIGMAKSLHTKLVFCHIYNTPYLIPEAGMVYDASFSIAIQSQAEKSLTVQIDQCYADLGMGRNLNATDIVVIDAISLSSGIEKLNHKYAAELVIMGTHGATGLKKFFMGSNTVDVIKNSKIPVLSVPQDYEFKQLIDIVYASDFTDLKIELNYVTAFAKELNAKLSVIHIAQDKNVTEIEGLVQKWKETSGFTELSLHFLNINADSKIDDSIRNFLADFKTDLLVVFHEHRNLWKSLFEKSIASELVYEWKAPILTLYK